MNSYYWHWEQVLQHFLNLCLTLLPSTGEIWPLNKFNEYVAHILLKKPPRNLLFFLFILFFSKKIWQSEQM